MQPRVAPLRTLQGLLFPTCPLHLELLRLRRPYARDRLHMTLGHTQRIWRTAEQVSDYRSLPISAGCRPWAECDKVWFVPVVLPWAETSQHLLGAVRYDRPAMHASLSRMTCDVSAPPGHAAVPPWMRSHCP